MVYTSCAYFNLPEKRIMTDKIVQNDLYKTYILAEAAGKWLNSKEKQTLVNMESDPLYKIHWKCVICAKWDAISCAHTDKTHAETVCTKNSCSRNHILWHLNVLYGMHIIQWDNLKTGQTPERIPIHMRHIIPCTHHGLFTFNKQSFWSSSKCVSRQVRVLIWRA